MADLIESAALPDKNAVEQFNIWVPTADLKMVGPVLIGILPDMRVIQDYNHPAAIEVLFLFSFLIEGGAVKIATDGDFYWHVMPMGEVNEEGQLVVQDPKNVQYILTTPDDGNKPFTRTKIQAAIKRFCDEAHGE